MWRCCLLPALLFSALAAGSQPSHSEYFRITVIDAATGRGVPLVELKTTNAITVYTDSNGVVAWYEPGLMDRDVYFCIQSPGYFFSNSGKTLRTTRGGSIVLKIERLNIAERLYRITGQGIYRDSILTGTPVPLRNPVLNGEVMGQDTVFAMPYRGKLFWLWDDTGRAAGPVFSFAGCAATSELPVNGGLDPSVGVDLKYFLDESGFCRQITPFPVPGMKWKTWAIALKDEQGQEQLVTRYQSMKDLGQPYEIGLAVFNDEKEVFERFVRFGKDAEPTAAIHPFHASAQGVQFLYFPGPLPDLRARAEPKALADPATYEGFSCLTAGSRYANGDSRLDRAPEGKLIYSWKRNTLPLTFDQEKELIKTGKMTPEEGHYQLRDVLTGAAVKPIASSVYWNDYRARWIMIVQEVELVPTGEIWYAEGDTPVGPWVYARKIVTHDKYNFYNPTQHPFFDQDGGRLVYFEGTYSDSSSGSPETPRYSYNEIMYRLALDDPRLLLPVPVYRMKNGQYMLRGQVASSGAWGDVEEIPFFALPPNVRPEGSTLVGGIFSALPATTAVPSETLAGRWKCREGGGLGFKFHLVLQRSGGLVSGTLDGTEISNVTLEDDRLAFEVNLDGESYQVSLSPGEGKLAGRWKKGQEGDTVECRLVEDADWAKSPDVIPLYSYRRRDGSVLFSTDANRKDPGLERSTFPIGRVWRNPMRVLTLDPVAVAR